MGFRTSNGAPSPAIDAAAANFSAYRVGPRSAAHRPDDASHRRESAIPFAIAKKREPAETFSERTNQDEVSSSLIGAVLAISVGKMLSYIARAS
jgi:hypothetical protein